VFKNKKGVVGFSILVVFAILAAVPQFFTPYQPIATTDLAGSMSAPLWMRYLPEGSGLSENLVVIPNPGFDTAGSLNDFDYVSEEHELIRVWHSSSFGYGTIYGNGPGCVAITYEVSHAPAENATINLERTFVYPYAGPPERFTGDIALFVSGTSSLSTSGDIFLLVPAKVTIFIRNEAGHVFNLWTTNLVTNPTVDWVTSRTSSQISDLDSRSQTLQIFMYGMIYDNGTGTWIPYVYRHAVHPELDVFGDKPQNMTFGVEIKFFGNAAVNNAKTTVFIDGLYFRTFGTSWGLLGTDKYGRDLFAQLVYGVRLSLYVGFLASIIGVLLGLFIGLASGYMGKTIDELLMRFADALLVIPHLPLLIVLIAVLGATINNLIILLGLLGWMGFARTVRSQVLSLRERPFIEAAKAAGAGRSYIMLKHVLPNIMSLVYVTLATSVPGAVVAEASLSFLGFYDPNVMSWGRMLNAVQFEASGAFEKWWWAVPPGLCIAALALSFILIGFSMDEVLNPRLRARA
jgi:ABC-type dipeptide/oligopeptide/nickel transport system permease subunit